jgi:aromatic ring-opening dioxygenase LigB subunit
MATTHAFTFMAPEEWDDVRDRNRESFKRRRGKEAPIQPQLAGETLEANRERFKSVQRGHDALRRELSEEKPDALIIIGDDQNEVFSGSNVPQLAVYIGGAFTLSPRFCSTRAKYRSHDSLASEIMSMGVKEGFDVAMLGSFDDDELASHAHAQVLDALLPDADIPVVLIFVNAIHYPAIEPWRCYQFGALLSRMIAGRPDEERVVLCASGGLSHFTAGYPWDHYSGPFEYGSISEDFDRDILAAMQRGDGARLAELTGEDLLLHGNIELRTWIALLGAMGPVAPRFSVYEPFYRAIMGMAVVSWPAAIPPNPQ